MGFIKKGGTFERTPKYDLQESSKTSQQKIYDHIPLDKITLLEILYLIILVLGFTKFLSLGGIYLFNAIYLIFLSLGLLNLILSEFAHAFSS